MLTPQQITQARATLGITPVAPSNPTDFSSKFAAAMGTTPATPATPAPVLGQDKLGVGNYAGNAIKTQAESGVNQVKEGYNDATKAPDILGKTEAGMKMAAGAIGTVTAPLAPAIKPIGDIATWLGEKIGNTKAAQDFVTQHPDAAAALSRIATDTGNTSVVLGTAMGTEGGIKGMPETVARLKSATGDIVDTVKTEMNNAHNAISNALEPKTPTETPVSSNAIQTSATDNIRSYFAKDNIDPRLEASAKRLEDPVATYADYSSQAEKAVTDVKADPPIAKVGENIGNAYDNVIKMRRTVGQNMADELAKVKDTPVDIGDATGKFVDEADAGAGKMTSFDKQLIKQYDAELGNLGTNPTAGQVDDFLSRVQNELGVAKAAKNITDVTNAERIIKGNLADICNSLTKQPGMEGYATARKAYSDLSNFLDEGSKYLGGKTQGGDYTRDVSVAKSSAESILSGGKKDWLLNLEKLTGYKALDDATLAIQAMKDAGDTRGLSLFKAIGDVGLNPTSLPFKIMEWGGKKVAGKIMGTSAEQTKAFLQSLKTEGVPK